MKLRQSRRNGVTAVELALVAPIFILIIFGLFEFSRMTMLQESLTNAAREGSRLAALASTVNAQDVDDCVRQHLRGAIANPSDTSKVRVNITPNTTLGSIPSETVISVVVDVDFADVALLVPRFLGGTGIRGEAQMKRE